MRHTSLHRAENPGTACAAFFRRSDLLGTIAALPHNVADSQHILFLSCLSEPVPYSNVLTIGSILSDRDLRHVESYIAGYRQQAAKKQLHTLISEFFDERLFFHNLTFSDKYEALRFLTGKITACGYAPETFAEEVLQRERISSTCFMGAFALPHALTFCASHSALCILSSDTAFHWDEHQIKFVCLLVLAEKDREHFQPLYQHLVDILCNAQSLSAITAAPDPASFTAQIELLF